MPKHAYKIKKIGKDRLRFLAVVSKIIESYAARGFDLTLRQAYYQCVARDLFPDDRKWTWTGSKWVRDPDGTKNAEPNYKWLGSLLDDGRMLGLIDWDTIVDRTRSIKTRSAWDSPAEVIDAAYRSYHKSRWENQTNWPYLLVEKEALAGVFDSVCHRYDLPLFACRGYTSQSAHWRLAQDIISRADKGYHPVILHFGDHDPSGVDMTRDIEDRLRIFGAYAEVRRIALNMDQIELYQPPPNPAKSSDARFKKYLDEFGEESWELDALTPEVLADLVTMQVDSLRDLDAWNDTLQEEQGERAQLRVLSLRWEQLSGYLRDEYGIELSEAIDHVRHQHVYREEVE